MINHEIIIKREKNNEIVLITILDYKRLNNEFLIMDSIILAYFWFYIPFRKILNLKYAIL